MEAGWVEGLPYGSAEGSKEGWVLAGTPAASGLSISAAARETACFGLGSGSGFGFGFGLATQSRPTKKMCCLSTWLG